MTTPTTNLGLTTYNNSTDQSGSFITWTQDMSGSSSSNMTKIDEYAGGTSASITNLSSSMSGSVSTLTSQISSLDGEVTTTLASVLALNNRLKKLDEFSGDGQADFTDISGSHTHLLLIGVTAGSHLGATAGDVGIDFNGDSVSANYNSLAWIKSSGAEYFNTGSNYGSIRCGYTTNNVSSPNFGIPLFVIIPNYTATSGLNKSAFGIGAGFSATNQIIVNGGYWRSTAAITRIRVFVISGDSYRYNFYAGTKFTLYGLG